MERVDLYRFPHKVQRAHLFALSTKIGRADLTNQMELNEIEKSLRLMIRLLREHSEHEATFIHPLYKEVGDSASPLDEEHDDLEKELVKLEKVLEEKRWSALYEVLNRFIGHYLLHQDEEETEQTEVLWKHFDDSRLLAVMNAFKASRPSSSLKEDLELAIPCLNLVELTQMFQMIKMAAPKEALQMALEIANSSLDGEFRNKLQTNFKS